MNKRQSYRISDTIPLIYRKMPNSGVPKRASFTPGVLQFSFEPLSVDAARDMDPNLIKMFNVLDSKLNLILERLCIHNNGLSCAENHPVNISEGGLCLMLPEPFNPGEIAEFKLMLPTIPYSALVIYGKAERVNQLTGQDYEVAFKFMETEDDVRDVLSRYILQRQRGVLRSNLECLYDSEKSDRKNATHRTDKNSD